MDYSDNYISSSEDEYNSHHSDDERESPRKRMKHSYVDRITNLPDELINHILSQMSFKAAIRTQLLSKRWRYAWASSPALKFSGSGDLQDEELKVINNALMLHKGPIINLSLLGIGCLRDGIDPPINVWVQCAVHKQIEVLVLELECYEESYFLPQSFFVCDSLREFSLNASNFDLGYYVSWKSLKKLTLKSVRNLYNDKIHKIISGSPELESLILSDCAGFSRIIVSSTRKLRNLVISHQEEDGNDVDDGDKLEITGPSITSLDISGEMGRQYCELEDVSSLVQVSFRFCMTSSMVVDHEEYPQACQSMVLRLLRKTSHVEKLSLGSWCTQVLSLCELEIMPTILLKCKTLEIDLLNERSIPGIARLLRRSIYLERLTFYMDPFNYDQVDNVSKFSDFNGKNYWKSLERADFKHLWQNLKVVEFIGLFDETERTFMAEFAEYVLDHAKVLEKLVLNPGEACYRECQRSNLRHSNLFYVIQKLLSYPRCSRQASVLLM
ncbi:F-box protein At5g03100-like [Silene latifolia]|uniref:F-box protein At5g03100-like n=1 Tax=Silene latifolia TaxID=37657 RepID=UPI003D77DA76